MSKRVVSIVLALVVLVVGVVVVHNHTTNTYDSKVRVIDVVGERVAVVDIYDDVYEFYGTGYTVGEEIVVVLHTNHTADVHDDEIVATRQSRLLSFMGGHIASLVGVSDANYPIVQPAQKTN